MAFGSSSSPIFQQPFVVVPGFSLIPAKTVSQILASKFVDLSDLLPVNIVQHEPELHVYLDGHLVVTSAPKKQRRKGDGHSYVARGFRHLHTARHIIFSAPLERSNLLQITDLADILPLQRPRVAGV